MVKGISRQVIVIHSPDPDLFEQAIFILKDGHKTVTDEALLKEAKRLINAPAHKKKHPYYLAPIWAFVGALSTAFVWLICSFI